jgi:hypothetical protein
MCFCLREPLRHPHPLFVLERSRISEGRRALGNHEFLMTRVGMCEFKPYRVQAQPRRESGGGSPTVELVTQQRVAYGFHMQPQLMCPAGHWLQCDAGDSAVPPLQPLENTPPSQTGPPFHPHPIDDPIGWHDAHAAERITRQADFADGLAHLTIIC